MFEIKIFAGDLSSIERVVEKFNDATARALAEDAPPPISISERDGEVTLTSENREVLENASNNFIRDGAGKAAIITQPQPVHV